MNFEQNAIMSTTLFSCTNLVVAETLASLAKENLFERSNVLLGSDFNWTVKGLMAIVFELTTSVELLSRFNSCPVGAVENNS